ncbi:hypothetical protein PspLS_04221 [Pyricularia sp. CBS 133598]|nr:hypothetical protein PspLS_04221 [Pyricularia sp. CBS 133598]
MRASKPLALIKGIFESYHSTQPLDQTKQTKLYEIITKSFRNQLDKELGLPAEQPQDLQPPAVAKSFENTPKLTLSPPTEAPRAALGSQHLRSILSNPLFSYDASKANGLRAQGEKDPMDIFEEAAARGLMTQIRAAGCLKAKHRQIMQSSAMDPVTVMASSSAGQKVVEWIRSSGLEKELRFINHDVPLVRHLMPFLIAEGMEKTVWVWLDMLSKDLDGPRRQRAQIQLKLLFEALVESKYQGATSMNDAYACMTHAREIFPWAREEEVPRHIMTSWKKVAWESTVLAWKHLTKSSPELFDLFYRIGEDEIERLKLQSGNYRPQFGIDLAHLALHHPTAPRPSQALEILLSDKKDSIWRTWSKQSRSPLDPGIAPSPGAIRLRAFGLDTIKVCVSHGLRAEAESLLRKMAPHLGKDFRMSIDDVKEDYEDTTQIFGPEHSTAFR